jgi:hypothetical protein
MGQDSSALKPPNAGMLRIGAQHMVWCGHVEDNFGAMRSYSASMIAVVESEIYLLLKWSRSYYDPWSLQRSVFSFCHGPELCWRGLVGQQGGGEMAWRTTKMLCCLISKNRKRAPAEDRAR